MTVKIFYKDNCPRCPKAKELGKQLEEGKLDVKYFNIGDADGLSEAVFYDVLATPAVLVTDSSGKELASFRTEVPSLDEIKKHLN